MQKNVALCPLGGISPNFQQWVADLKALCASYSFEVNFILSDKDKLKNFDAVLFCGQNYTSLKTAVDLGLYAQILRTAKATSYLVTPAVLTPYTESDVCCGKLGREAYDKITMSAIEMEKVLRIGFELAEKYFQPLMLADTSENTETGKLFRYVLSELVGDYPDVIVNVTAADALAAQIANGSFCGVAVTDAVSGKFCSALLKNSFPSATSYVANSSFGLFCPCDNSRESFIITASEMLKHSLNRKDIADALGGVR